MRDIEELLPQPQDWSLDGEGYLVDGRRLRQLLPRAFAWGTAGRSLSDEEARLYIYDDLGVSQRWANKFSEAGIETVADLVGRTEDDLLRIEGIGVKAIEELKEGLAERGLVARDRGRPGGLERRHVAAARHGVQPRRHHPHRRRPSRPRSTRRARTCWARRCRRGPYQRNLEELDALLGSMGSLGSFGFGLTSREDEQASNERMSNGEE